MFKNCFSMATILDRKDNSIALKFDYVIGIVVIELQTEFR